MSDIRISTEWLKDVCIVHLDGEARLETVAPFDEIVEEIAQRGVRYVALEMSGLSFMDSASAGILLRLRSRLDAEDGRLVLYDVRKLVAKMLDRTGLGTEFPRYATRDEALAALA